MNTIYLRRARKVIIDTEPLTKTLPQDFMGAMVHNISRLGFLMSPVLYEAVSHMSAPEATTWYAETVSGLKLLVGANVKYRPMYPNFPQQVMDASDSELFLNAIFHYMGDVFGVRIMPKYRKKPRRPLSEGIDYKMLDLGTHEDYVDVMRRLMAANTSTSETDKEDIKTFLHEQVNCLTSVLPESIPHKENLSFIAGVLLNAGVGPEVLHDQFKTATDVLRLATALSDGDVSLAEKTRYRNFNRAERRFLLSLLDGCGGLQEDMLRHKTKWLRLGERLHPAELRNKKQFGKAFRAFDALRKNKRIETFNSRVEAGLEQNKAKAVAKLLKDRPGDFARRLDKLLRTARTPTAKDSILKEFRTVTDRVATPVLLQVYTHFKHRNEHRTSRAFFPRGQLAKVQLVENILPKLSYAICNKVSGICHKSLVKRFKTLAPLGNVYIEENLEGCLVPFSQRSASKGLRTIARGSRLDIPEGDVIRFFIWWKDISRGNRVDVDLASVMLDWDWNYLTHVSYTNLRHAGYSAYHSGDITSAPHGACEFIDVDMKAAVKSGARYLVMNVLSFTRQPFSEMPECYAGWMSRNDVQSGEVFEPSTVQDKIDLGADTRYAIPLVIDMKQRKVVWMDMSLKSNPRWANNVESNQRGTNKTAKALAELVKPNLYDLFSMHAKARGKIVKRREAADTVFALDGDVTPFDFEEIAANYIK